MKQRSILIYIMMIWFGFSFNTIAKIEVSINEKPNVVILATGGTIAGSAASKTNTTIYTSGSLGVDTLIQAVPELADVANVTGQQIANVDSNEIDTNVLLTLSQRIDELLATELNKTGANGVVVTHGTDTLEETAFFLDITLNTTKPVVLVGAMRPATAISADGPMNLLQAVSLAADSDAQNRGVLVVLNSRISSGFYITKTHTGALDTFKATEQGYLGTFINHKPIFYYSPSQPTSKPHFNISKLESLPKVIILYGHQSLDPQLLEAAVDMGAKGIIIAATGDGSLTIAVKEKVKQIMAKGIPVVLSSRTGSGLVTFKDIGIASGIYNPQKSRILLSLALSQQDDVNKISRYFLPIQ